MLKRFVAAALAVSFLVAGSGASAATFSGDWSVTGHGGGSGLIVSTDVGTGSFGHSLAVGESVSFKLFRIWTDERQVNTDDRDARPISVAFDFLGPFDLSGQVDGTTAGVGSTFKLGRSAVLNWDEPLVLSFGPQNSGLLTLTLSEAVFASGAWELSRGMHHGADIYATLTYSVAPVPVPAALPLMLGGLGLLGWVARRRAAAG